VTFPTPPDRPTGGRRESPALLPPRLGIFGGTFNPIHCAHLRVAEEVREAQGLNRVVFVPSGVPPHKGREHLAPAAHRLTMVRLAIRGNPYFRASAIEIERKGRSYAVDTVRAFCRGKAAARVAFILGLDAFAEIGTWKDYRSLFALCDMVVIARPGADKVALDRVVPVAARGDFCYSRRTNSLEHTTGHTIVFQRPTPLATSASLVRARLADHRSIRYLVPPAVERYIARHGLYGSRAS
jgi:nicotinate-nucleotide adenylyltransferase